MTDQQQLTSSSSLLSAIFGNGNDGDEYEDNKHEDKRSSSSGKSNKKKKKKKKRNQKSHNDDDDDESAGRQRGQHHLSSLFDRQQSSLPLPQLPPTTTGTVKRFKRSSSATPEHSDRSNKNANEKEPNNIVQLLKRRNRQSKTKFLQHITAVSPTNNKKKTKKKNKDISSLEFLELPYDVQIQEIADILRRYGVVVIRDVLANEKDILDKLCSKANTILNDITKAVMNKRRHGDNNNNNNNNKFIITEELFRYDVVASRCRGRIDTRYKTNEYPFNLPCIIANDCILPVVQQLLSSGAVLVYAGLIFSFPGSDNQPWHQDGEPLFPDVDSPNNPIGSRLPPYALNVFIPLSDNDNDNGIVGAGPTEFVPGSHVENENTVMQRIDQYEKQVEEEEDLDDNDNDDESPVVVSPLLCQGDALIYDYRICHRGTSNVLHKLTNIVNMKKNMNTKGKIYDNDTNPSQQQQQQQVRRILYLMYARPWYEEHVNFGTEPLFGNNKGRK